MNFNKRNIFAIDGIGAIFSSLLTGLLLPLFSDQLGLSISILYFLAAISFTYAVYSLFCYWKVKNIKAWMLKVIILANLAYCLLSSTIIFTIDGITVLGQALLVLEIFIVIAVVVFEFRLYRKFYSRSKI